MRITREAKARAVMYAAATGREIGEVVEGLIAANLPELPAEVAAMCGAA